MRRCSASRRNTQGPDCPGIQVAEGSAAYRFLDGEIGQRGDEADPQQVLIKFRLGHRLLRRGGLAALGCLGGRPGCRSLRLGVLVGRAAGEAAAPTPPAAS